MTAVKRVKRLAEVERDLKSKRDALERSNRLDAVGQLAAGIAHDFNNQLAALKMMMERLKTEVTTDRTQSRVGDALNVIEESELLASRLVSLSSQGDLLRSDVNIHDIFDNIGALVPTTSTDKLSLHIAPVDPGLVAFCDRSQLVNAILNLVLNANDAISDLDAGGSITVSAKLCEAGKVCLTVKDNGSGMSEDVLRKCSDPFFTTKKDRNGTGLGLAMVQSFANDNHGELLLSTTIGVGTEATLVLPKGQEAQSFEQTPPLQLTELDAVPNILLVEDNAHLGPMIKELLEEQGFIVQMVENAEDALAYLTTKSDKNLIITDINMPGMNGFELAENVHATHPNIKFIYLTGFAVEAVQKGRKRLGPILRKPIEPAKLIALVSDAFAK